MDDNGEPNADNYIFDGLHLSDRGYSIWREIIRQRLLDDFGGNKVVTPTVHAG